jgi:holo-[acyl-carrier protein] synthase
MAESSATENSASAQQVVSAAAASAQAKGILPESVSMGVDIVEVERIRAIMGRSPAFVERAFSCEERAYCDSTAQPEFHYATRFAAKEAVLKALGTGFSRGIKAADVEVALNSKGKPSVRLKGRAAKVAAELGVEEIPLSLSYTHNEAVACAIALTASDREKAEPKKVNPAKDLSRKFKEARSLLDELPVANAEEGA